MCRNKWCSLKQIYPFNVFKIISLKILTYVSLICVLLFRVNRKRRHEVIMSDVIFSEEILDDLQLTEECLAALVLLQLSHSTSAISKESFSFEILLVIYLFFIHK